MVKEVTIKGVVNSRDNNQAHIVTDDVKTSYTMINPKAPEDYIPTSIEWVEPDKVDYNYLPDQSLQHKYKNSQIQHKGLPMSFLQIQTVEEGAEYYKATTQYPDLVCEMLARYEWGDLRYTTKKEFKNQKKKRERKKTTPQTLKVTKGNLVVKFE
eukprot:COSAG01_NODE_2882_length_6914_cov_40.714894_10_plen_155_part_00